MHRHLLGVWRWGHSLRRIRLVDERPEDVVLLFGELEQTALVVSQRLTPFEIRCGFERLVKNRLVEAFDFLELDARTVARVMQPLGDSANADDFALRTRDVPDENVPWLDFLEVPVLLAFVAVLVMGRVCLL